MAGISVVIVCKNESAVIARTLESLQGLTDDIILYDNGSTDDTAAVARRFPVQWHTGSWEGFGATKNKAIALARYDWILSLDADEAIDEKLKQALQAADLSRPNQVFDLNFKTFLGNKEVRHGEWGGDHHIRLFNRSLVRWNDAAVHERLQWPAGTVVKKMDGHVLHYSMADTRDYASKMLHYALLNADKYFRAGKKASWFKLRLSPGFSFVQNYLLRLGFLDGYEGYLCAKMTAYYTFMKYARLRELVRQAAK